ncbi:hypothetical protein AB0M79_30770 [Polymorphospora sp. NPDC051019]|uniref:ATP-dependent DNA ligase n=1 Tax=Polymorphospora sp. NPDC051019 TaxID=3155725 RepID=UPI00343E4C82
MVRNSPTRIRRRSCSARPEVQLGRGHDFALLRRWVTAGRQLAEIARSHPAHFVAFDLLSTPGGESLLDRPLHERRGRLAQMPIDAPPNLVLCPQTTDVHEERLRTWPEVGVEGVVVKRCDGCYEPGRRVQSARLHA